MPHVNVCDLSVFPNMSKRHTQLARDHHGTHVLTEEQIWKAAEEVFKQLPSSKIASGFIQTYRLAKKLSSTAETTHSFRAVVVVSGQE